MSTKCCTFLPKREFLLQILHCVVELTIFNVNRNFTFACRELKWNIMRSILSWFLCRFWWPSTLKMLEVALIPTIHTTKYEKIEKKEKTKKKTLLVAQSV